MKKIFLFSLFLLSSVFLTQSISAQTWSAPKRLTWNSGQSLVPKIATDSTNQIHVVWYDNTTGNEEVYYKHSTDGGITWTGQKRLTWNLNSSENPAISLDSNDHLHIVWEEGSSGNIDIYYKKSTNGGTAWSAPKRMTWNSGESLKASIAADSLNHLHVVWFDTTPFNQEIYYKKKDAP